MNTADQMARSLFNKESVQDCNLEELQTIARQYPFFASAQFLLAEKLRTGEEDLYRQQVEKLSLHFTNPLWLDFLLNSYKSEPMTETRAEHDAVRTQGGFPEDLQAETRGKDDMVKTENVIASPETKSLNESSNKDNIVAPVQPVTEQEPDVAIVAIDPTPEPINSTEHDLSGPTADVIMTTDEKMAEQGQANEFAQNTNDTSESDLPDNPDEEVSGPSHSISLPPLNEEPAETEITFQPYHTVDYFASQGIKFVSEEKPADRFGQQLKSFTEWLKAMKRLPEAETIKLSEAQPDERVQQLADHSINEDEVVTETMADVWKKQGDKEKAIAIYEKLSLLNPSKSSYFASLAEQLKNS